MCPPPSPITAVRESLLDERRLKLILEAALLAAGRPLSLADMEHLFSGAAEAPTRDGIRAALAGLSEDWSDRSLALQEVASGYRAQVRNEFEPWIAQLWEERPPKFSRALLETLAIIAYRQPITRSEIEEIRGVSVSTQIIRSLTERQWVRVVGHREAPGRPAMYGTTRQFLDHFNLKSLDQLPPLSEIREMDARNAELGLEGEPASPDSVEGTQATAASASEDESGSGEAAPVVHGSEEQDGETAAGDDEDTPNVGVSLGAEEGHADEASTGAASAQADAEFDSDDEGSSRTGT